MRGLSSSCLAVPTLLPSLSLPSFFRQRLFQHLLLALLVILLGIGKAAAVTLAVDGRDGSYPLASVVEYLEDRDGSLSVDDLRRPEVSARFRRSEHPEHDLNFGYSPSIYWLRLNFQAASASAWLLEVAFPSLDRVDAYLGERPLPLQAGDQQVFAARPVIHRNLVFPLDLPAAQSFSVILRVQSQGSLTLPLTLWEPTAFATHNLATYAALALYYGALAALFGYNLLIYLATRERSFLEYVLCVAGMAIGQLSLNGFGNQFVWPDWPQWGNIALPTGFAICGLFGAMFTRTFLATRRTAPWLDRAIVAFIVLFGFTTIAPLFLPYRLSAALVSVFGLSFSLLAVLCGVRCLQRGAPGARFYLLAWSLLLLGVGVMSARNFSWLPTNFVTTYAMQLGSSLEMLLLSLALADRINVMRRAKESAQSDALAANQQLVTALQESEHQLELRVQERTQALAEANRQLQANEKLLQQMVHHDPLTGLANRLLLDDRLQHALSKAQRQNSLMAVLLIDLDGFKPVNDTYGHAAGDQLLVMAAQRLLACVREADTVARLGGDEFVVVLEDGKDSSHLERIASTIVHALSEPYPIGRQQLHISASVGIASFPDDGQEALTLLKRADQAMYEAKAAGRNCYRCYAVSR